MINLPITTGDAWADKALVSLINAYSECAKIIRCDGPVDEQVLVVCRLIGDAMCDVSSESEVEVLYSDVQEIIEANRRLYIEGGAA